jgi:thiol-disulfide isomerase/thioredoxin
MARIAARLLGLILVCTSALAGAAPDSPPPSPPSVVIHFISGDGCPHCAEARPFLDALAARHPGVRVHELEIWKNRDNRPLAQALAARWGMELESVPVVLVGSRYWVGFAEEPIGREIAEAVAACVASGCPEPQVAPDAPRAQGSASIAVPGIGTIDLGSRSLLASTALIAFVDGFNACSLWVLTLLLAVTLHTGSRGKVMLIGLTFLTVTSAVYALFIAGLFGAMTVLSFADWLRVLMAVVALLFAAINIKDYFWYGRGPSLSISDDAKPGLYRRMRAVTAAGNSLPALLGATVVLSASASLVEFACTAGFPVLWTQLLAQHGVSGWQFVGLLLLYMLIYQADELLIFGIAVWTMRAMRVEERHGRVLKLASGMLMLALGLVMLIAPDAMDHLAGALAVFGAAALATVLVLLLQRLLGGRWTPTAR